MSSNSPEAHVAEEPAAAAGILKRRCTACGAGKVPWRKACSNGGSERWRDRRPDYCVLAG